MNYGRFFVLDYTASDIVNGITVFNYRGVKHRKVDGRCECAADTPKYPIYLSFTTEGVFFYLHYAILAEDGLRIIHQNSPILSLPVSSNFDIRDNLTKNLNDIYCVVFPFNGDGDFFYELAAENVASPEDRKKGITYSSLEIFGIQYRKPAGVKNPPMVGFLRKLFLDFLYDLEHTDVFENSALCEEVSIKLHENFLFRAIANKAEYYYQRKQQNWISAKDYPWEKAERDLFYADYFSRAEQVWVETIADARASRCFYESEWFDSVETEMDRIYLPGTASGRRDEYGENEREKRLSKSCNNFLGSFELQQDGTEKSKKLQSSLGAVKKRVRDTAKSASNWYIQKYSFSGTLKIWYGANYLVGGLLLLLFALTVCVSLAVPPDMFRSPMSDLISFAFAIIFGAGILLTLSAVVSNRRYLTTIGLVNVLMPRLFSSIVAGWFTLAIGEDIFKGFFDRFFQPFPAAIMFVILCVFVYYEISKINPYVGVLRRASRSLILLVIAFIYSYIVGFLVIAFFGEKYLERSDYLDRFYEENVFTPVPEFRVRTNQLGKSVHTIFYTVLSKQNDTLQHAICRTCAAKQALIERMNVPAALCRITDTIDSRLTFYLADKFLGDRTAEDMSSRIKRVEQCIEDIEHGKDTTFVNAVYDEKQCRHIWATLLRCVHNQKTYRTALDHMESSDSKRKHTIFVGTLFGLGLFRDMLLQFTFFAMFIGIFIQLIFEEKPISEPL